MEYEEEPPQQEYGIPVGMDSVQDGVLKHWLDPDSTIEKFEYVLSGHKKNFSTNEWVKMEGEQWLNSLGVNKVIGSIVNHLDKTVFLTDLSDEEINREAYAFRMKLIKMLAMNEIKFETDLDSYGSMIVNNCGSIVFHALKRARKFQTAKALTSSTQIHQVEQRVERSERVNQEKRGLLSFLSPQRRLR